MKILCLHGRGTNGQILEVQTAAIRMELGDNHTYEYVDGVVPAKLAPEIEMLFPANDDYYDYWGDSIESKLKALFDLEEYIKKEGPFDGVLAFSQGALLATVFLIHEAKIHPTKHLLNPAFRVAILFNSPQAVDPILGIESGVEKYLSASDGPMIHIHTAHIWGKNDHVWAKGSEEVAGICNPEKRTVFVHELGHEIPTTKNESALYGAVHAIRRTIDAASIVLDG